MKYTLRLEFSALRDARLPARLSRVRTNRVNRLDDVHALDDLAEDDVLAVEPGRLGRAEEELGPVRAGARVGHAQHAGARVLQPEVLVLELVPVDGLPARSVLVRKIPSLAHEARNDAMKRRRFVPESGFPGAQLTEVFRRFWAHVRSELLLLSRRGGVDRFLLAAV